MPIIKNWRNPGGARIRLSDSEGRKNTNQKGAGDVDDQSAHGKVSPNLAATRPESQKRPTLPIAPPIATHKYAIIISYREGRYLVDPFYLFRDGDRPSFPCRIISTDHQAVFPFRTAKLHCQRNYRDPVSSLQPESGMVAGEGRILTLPPISEPPDAVSRSTRLQITVIIQSLSLSRRTGRGQGEGPASEDRGQRQDAHAVSRSHH